ncbi:phosphinothricin acetyltransferase [Granulicella aggregans]|uniref:Phosphinothricin acetyltransferase n=1 Tax=Granulicella aggregans TaxID=474949 RepID=A0A7W8E2N0_9BACT|nr:GNAT family N-acetyltransferase [Granulicella aggregans]MBB5055340.1 phosphinothricin acetyltransferase [Granulicella aggregans]
MADSILVRAAVAEDATAIAAIYAPHVLNGVTSFEVVVPDVAEILRRREAVLELGLPYLVAEIDGEVAGYAYASQFRPRAAYRFTVENSVYVAKRFQRRGVARHLMRELIEQSARAGMRQMIAVIAEPSGSTASVALHRSLGFEEVGVLCEVGEKFGRAVDVLIMQRALIST